MKTTDDIRDDPHGALALIQELRQQLAQAQAALDETRHQLASMIDWADGHDYELPAYMKGWLSPDEAKALQAQCAAMREAFRAHLKLTDELKGRELPVEKRWFDEIVNARFEVEKALSATAGQELLSRLERYEKALKEIIAHVRFPDTWGDDLELKECVKMANEAMKGGGK